MRLVFYSGGQQKSNQLIHKALVQLTQKSKNITMTYVPFHSDRSEIYFRRIVRRYSRFGVSRFYCLETDLQPSELDIKVALKSDIIYLAGGNTFYFLDHLKKSGMLNHLKSFIRKGGILAGLSAGAMIFTPTIRLAGHPNLDPDENELNLKNLKGLGLVKFEFAPHYDGSRKTHKTLLTYSKMSRYPVIACPDGSGIVIENNSLHPLGQAILFSSGKSVALKSGSYSGLFKAHTKRERAVRLSK